jgi:hypothetical protein
MISLRSTDELPIPNSDNCVTQIAQNMFARPAARCERSSRSSPAVAVKLVVFDFFSIRV